MAPLGQAWVTCATDDVTFVQSLVLARSLRRVYTSRKIVVIITRNIPRDKRCLLEKEFDAVLLVDSESTLSSGISEELLAVLYCWKLTLFQKCVFIESSTLICKNCDELFNNTTEAKQISAFPDELNNGFETSVYAYKPSIKTFHLMASFAEKKCLLKKEDQSQLLNLYWTNWNNLFHSEEKLWKNCVKIIPQSGKLLLGVHDSSRIKLVLYAGNNLKNLVKEILHSSQLARNNVSHSNENLFGVWLDIFHKDVIPNLQQFGIDIKSCIDEKHEYIHKSPISRNGKISSVDEFAKDGFDYLNDGIAVIGMSCKFPNANNPEEFWDLLLQGQDAVSTVPKNRENFGWEDFDMKTKGGFLKRPIDEFDGKFFGISPREAIGMDPQQRLLLEVAWEALEDAGINPLKLRGSQTGVFMGAWNTGYETLMVENKCDTDFQRVYLGNSFGATSGRVSFQFGLNGPNIASEAGCSSSMVSIHLACESLRSNNCPMALAGGVNLLIHPWEIANNEHILSPDGLCKTFDESADGFVRAEGCGVLVLKKYSEAIKNGDRVLGLIRGSALSQEGTSSSFGTPTKFNQEIAIRDALKNAGISPAEMKNITYIEAHGTGTAVGDPVEIAAIGSVYKRDDKEEPLYIGSVKTNIGHTESAAGVAGVIKVLMSFKNGIIPAHKNLSKLNPLIDIDLIPAKIPLETTPWKRPTGGLRMAAVSSFGISGSNVHMIIQEPFVAHTGINTSVSNKNNDRISHPPLHILTLSAKNINALQDLANGYKNYLKSNLNSSVADVCYTSNTGRAHFRHRLAFVGKSCQDLVDQLAEHSNREFSDITGKKEGSKIAFLFTGQGSQYAGMGKQLYMTHTVFRQSVNHCADIIHSNFGVSLLNFLLNGTDSELEQTICSQTSIFCLEYALCQLWNSFGIKPDCVLGHSTGEFAAAVAAGIMSLEDALKLVYMRSKLLQSLPEGGMMAVMGNVYKVKTLVQAFNNSNVSLWLDVAVVNSEDEVVVAGRTKSLELFQTVCRQAGIKTKYLAASQAFHSRDVDLILDDFEAITSTVKYNPPNCKYISGTTGDMLTDQGLSSNYWKNHAKSSVNFNRATKTLWQENCNISIEIGANPVLLALILSNVTLDQSSVMTCLPSMRKGEDNLSTLLESLKKMYTQGLEIDWEGFHSSYTGHKNKVILPKYPFQRQSYWFEKNNFTRNIQFKEKVLHPLVGRKISLVTSENIYQHTLDLKNLSFIEHHKVANKIIMPGACFMEMLLVAGFATFTQCDDSLLEPSAPLSIENFSIEAPLELKENLFVDIQMIVTRSETEKVESSAFEFTASVHRKLIEDGVDGNWKKHATGTFSMFSSFEDRQVNLGEIQTRCPNVSSTDLLYEELLKIGLDFGSLFRSISKVWNNDSETLAEIPLPKEAGKLEEYFCHPILIDALIQCCALVSRESKDLYLPVGVKKFVWFSRKICPNYYAHSKIVDGKVSSVRLYDDCGNLLVLMEGIQIVRSSVTSFLKAVNVEKKLPGMYTEYWRENDNSPKKTFDLSNSIIPKDIGEQVSATLEVASAGEEEIEKVLQTTDKLLGLQIFKALKTAGWKPFIGEKLIAADFVTEHIIVPHFQNLIVRFFTVLTEDGFLECESETEYGSIQWKVVRLPNEDSLSEVHFNDTLISIANPMVTDVCKSCLPCVAQLPKALLGKESMLTALFSSKNDDDISIAEKIYSQPIIMSSSDKMFGKILKSVLGDIMSKNKQAAVFRVLEIGAGTGATSKSILTYLETSKISFKYTYTDISPVLVSKASKKFGDSLEYKILNVENDPKNQGYVPYSYDMVIAANVIHATEDLAVSIKNIRHLLAPHGYLMLFEILTPLRMMDIVFGPVEGFNRFKDSHIRKYSPIVAGKVWESIMKENGFPHTLTVETSGSRAGIILGKANAEFLFPYEVPITMDSLLRRTKNTWLLFSNLDNFSCTIEQNLKSIGKNVSIIQRSSEYKVADNDHFYLDPTKKEMIAKMYESLLNSQDKKIEGIIYNWGMFSKDNEQNMLQGLLYLSQNILTLKSKSFPKLFVFTRGAQWISEDDEVISPASASFSGFVNTLKHEQINLQCFCVDLDPASIVTSSEINNILWGSHNYYLFAIRSGKFYSPRTREIATESLPLKFPNSPRFKLILPESKSISDVVLGPSERFPINETQIEIAVKAVGLNFRDVLIIMKPDGYSSFFDTEIGTDFAGVVVSVGSKVKKFKAGDEIFGASFRGSLNSHAIVQSELSCLKPKHVTFLEAATLPSVYYTAYHCLINIAKLTKEDVILIHVASGGVGLIAIQLAQQIGARIIATAGSRRKRAYLRLLGIQHVFHSRDTSYGKDIEALKSSGISGVDVVLNSLTSPGFKEASLRVCRKNARFIEIGKINIWQPETVFKLREDVDYSIVNLENLSLKIMSKMVQKLEEDVSSKMIEPLPLTRFEMANVREALNYLRRAHHIGKVVVAIPEYRFTNGKFEFVEKLFDSESTYLITGGLGGIGLEVAKWMATSGARNFVLVGRSLPNEAAQETLKFLSDQGINVVTKRVDVGDFLQCKRLLQLCSETLPPIRGVMHAAGALSDAIIINQTWDKFETVFNAKVKGAWNLHVLTQKYRLEHFVLYSSVTSLSGTLAQSNHASANHFMDALAKYRHSLGLAAQTINWGAWSDIGAAALAKHSIEDVYGGIYFTPTQGINALRETLLSKRVQTMVLNFNQKLRHAAPFFYNEYMKDIVRGNLIQNDDKSINLDSKAFSESLKDEPLDARSTIIQSHIERIVRDILKLPESEKIDYFENFSTLGLDSLMAVEMKNKLQILMGNGISLNATTMLDFPSVKTLADYLATLTLQNANSSSDVSLSAHITQNKNNLDLVHSDSILPAHIKCVDGHHKTPSEFRNILLTGVTGNLGVYILKNLVLRKNIRIYCLVRHKSESGARGKVMEALQKSGLLEGLLNSISQNKVVFLPGDITEEYFGLPKQVYDDLTCKIDCIFHFSCNVNHLQSYEKCDNRQDIRSVNVLGLIRILEFASTSANKHLFFPTSYSTLNMKSSNFLNDEHTNPEKIKIGFSLTKLVCEKLIKQAIQRGMKCSIFRLCTMIGDSKTGRFLAERNHVATFFFACMKLGIFPSDAKGWHILAADTGADIFVQLAFNAKIESDMYHICHPELFTKEDMQKICHEINVPFELVSTQEFATHFHTNVAQTSFNKFSELYPTVQDFLDMFTINGDENPLLPVTALYLEGNNNSKTFISQLDEKTRSLIPNFSQIIPNLMETMRRHIDYAMNSNILKN